MGWGWRTQASAFNQSYMRGAFYYSPGFIIAIFTLGLEVNFPGLYRAPVCAAAPSRVDLRRGKRGGGEKSEQISSPHPVAGTALRTGPGPGLGAGWCNWSSPAPGSQALQGGGRGDTPALLGNQDAPANSACPTRRLAPPCAPSSFSGRGMLAELAEKASGGRAPILGRRGLLGRAGGPAQRRLHCTPKDSSHLSG